MLKYLQHIHFMRHIFVCISFLCIINGAFAQCPGFNCWVDSLTIPIPSTTFPAINGATLTLSNTTCNDIQVPSITPSISDLLTFQLHAQLGFTCTGTWALSTPQGDSSGILDAVVSSVSVTSGVTIYTNATGALVGGVGSLCDVTNPTYTLTFQGADNNQTTILNQFTTEKYLYNELTTTWCSSWNNFVDANITDAFNTANQNANIYLGNTPTGPPTNQSDTDEFVDFVGNPILGLANYVLDDVVGADGVLGLNKIFDTLTNGTGAMSIHYSNLSIIQFVTVLQSLTFQFGGFSTVELIPQWLNVSGLNDWRYVEVFEPVAPQQLDTRTVMNNLQLSLEFIAIVNITDGPFKGVNMSKVGVLKTNLTGCDMFFELYLAMSKEHFDLLGPSQYTEPTCISGTLTNFQVDYFNLSFGMEQISVTPSTLNFSTAEQVLDSALAVFVQSYSEALPNVITGLLWKYIPLADFVVPAEIAKYFNSSQCPAPKVDGPGFNKAATLYAGVASIGTFFLIILAAYLYVQFSATREYTPLLTVSSKSNALLFNPHIPFLVRYGVLLALFANIAMFVASNASLGASVYLLVRTPDSVTQFPSLFNFSLVNSVRDMWNAKVYALSILIALFSGVWPYTKLVLMIICWVVPASTFLNLQRRGRILIMLDAMGKWSLIDTFVLMMMMVAFHFSLVPPVTPHTPAGSISFEAYVEPHFGFYSFLVATMLSLLITHLVIKVHQFSVLETETGTCDGSKEALWSHASQGSPQRAAYLLTFVTLLLSASAVLLGLGISIKSFEFEFKGAFGLLLQFLDDPNPIPFSVVSLGMSFPESSVSPDGLGTRFIQASFFIFAILMPCAYLVCLLVLWMVPLTYTFQNRLLTLTATIHAWSALEVFVVSIIAALLELQQFAQFIVGNRCDLINQVLATYADDMLHHDDKCFDVVATLKTGCWILFSACVIYVVVGSLVVKGCHNALKGRLERPGSVNSTALSWNPQVQVNN